MNNFGKCPVCSPMNVPLLFNLSYMCLRLVAFGIERLKLCFVSLTFIQNPSDDWESFLKIHCLISIPYDMIDVLCMIQSQSLNSMNPFFFYNLNILSDNSILFTKKKYKSNIWIFYVSFSPPALFLYSRQDPLNYYIIGFVNSLTTSGH